MLLHDYFLRITGGSNLFTMPEEQSKLWREIFNSASVASYILEPVPHIVQVFKVYCEILREHGRKSDIFSLGQNVAEFDNGYYCTLL